MSTNNRVENPIAAIWLISDGKPGHLNQSLGLADALEKLQPLLRVKTVDALGLWQVVRLLLRRGSNLGAKPQLLISAGHRTHLTLLAMKRVTGAPAVVLMKPSLPLSWFDLCLIPEHDQPPLADNVVVTQGAINRMQPGADKSIPGMMLIGGPSSHYHWDEGTVLAEITAIAAAGAPWLLTTSRRTPASFLDSLSSLALPNVEIIPYADTGPGWLAEKLPKAASCWVTPDSVSMVYEALTAGCSVGVFGLQQKASHRVAKGLAGLINRGLVATYARWCEQGCLPAAKADFDEAQRCARIVVERLLPRDGL